MELNQNFDKEINKKHILSIFFLPLNIFEEGSGETVS